MYIYIFQRDSVVALCYVHIYNKIQHWFAGWMRLYAVNCAQYNLFASVRCQVSIYNNNIIIKPNKAECKFNMVWEQVDDVYRWQAKVDGRKTQLFSHHYCLMVVDICSLTHTYIHRINLRSTSRKNYRLLNVFLPSEV